MRVAINAQLLPQSGGGGIIQVVMCLTKWLGQLESEDEYVIIGPSKDADWLKPYLGPNQRLVVPPPRAQAWKSEVPEGFKSIFGPLRPAVRKLYRAVRPLPPDLASPPSPWPAVPVSDGFFESLNCDVVHFPYQAYTVCARPTIYNVTDLQQRHYPQYWPVEEITHRETLYRAGCHFASSIVVGSQWTKDDVIQQYGIHPSRIQVIPFAVPSSVVIEPDVELLETVKTKYSLTQPFAYYPAMTWEHKNHIRLLEAIALLRDRHDLRVQLVCTGHKNHFWPQIEAELNRLKLSAQVRFLGLIPFDEIRAVYRLAQFIVSPSLFEQASSPMIEGWAESVPVASSSVTSLPDQAGDAALLFDAESVTDIARAIRQMSTDPELRTRLRERGTRRLQDFSWERTAKAYRAVYRRAAHRPLSEEDRWLLSWDWMKEPNKKRPEVL